MKASSFKYGLLTLTLGLITIIIALLPFHAFLTVWLSTAVEHYTALRLWKEVLMLLAGGGVLYLVCFDRKVRQHILTRKISWLIAGYLVVQLIWGIWAVSVDSVTPLAAAYGALLNSRYLVFFMLTWAISVRTDRLERRWPKLLLWPAAIVVLVGLAQVFLLPPDVLRHFGYGPDTISAVSTINTNDDFQRYMSTLRGPNPLGAYLLLPISALVVLLLRFPRSWNWARGLLLVGSMAMLVFSFSRSAWIGAVLAVITAVSVVWGRVTWQRYRVWLTAAAMIIVTACAGTAYALRNDTGFQNLIFHTQDNSTVATSSNGVRLNAIVDGTQDIVRSPLGHGTGSAGPASNYNEGQGRIAENYYIQIGQETGLIGVGLFVSILVVVAYLLWTRRRTTLALALLASLVGISFVNLLSHAWTDDTLAYIWWGLAGLAVGTPVTKQLTDEIKTN